VITLIDYGAGNLYSVTQALMRLGTSVEQSGDPQRILSAEKLILPGVGAFGAAMASLRQSGLDAAICEAVGRGTPFLGICLGFQLLFDSSEEAPTVPGLGLFKGCVRQFQDDVKIPQLGWNRVKQTRQSPLFDGVRDNGYFYFANSYCVAPDTDADMDAAETVYGQRFVSAAQKRNLVGVQFHPEKSQKNGKTLLENFIRWEGV